MRGPYKPWWLSAYEEWVRRCDREWRRWSRYGRRDGG